MSDVAIRVEGLGKRYRIGAAKEPYGTLRDALSSAVTAPLRRFHGRGGPASRGEFWALRDISFDVQHGEVLGVIGRNGAGKSTLLKILSRITEPTVGRAEIHGRVGSLLEVGTGFHPELSGRENIYLNGAILGMKRAEIDRKFDEIVEFAEITQFLDTPVKRYSSGMYMRLAFSIAAHLEPEILIVDEVLSVGDAAFQEKCLGKIGSVASEGRTVLFVTHNMGMVSHLCERAILLDAGHITFRGKSKNVISQFISTIRDTRNNHAWKVDQGKAAQVTGVYAETASGDPGTDFMHSDPIAIRIQYDSRADVQGAMLSVAVHDGMRHKVFTSETACLLAPKSRNGSTADHIVMEHTARMVIPAHTLTPGMYSITAAIHVPFREILDIKDMALLINIVDGGSPFAQYAGQDYGVVFVNCLWEIDDQRAEISGE